VESVDFVSCDIFLDLKLIKFFLIFGEREVKNNKLKVRDQDIFFGKM